MRLLAVTFAMVLMFGAAARAHDPVVPAGIDLKRLPLGDGKLSKEPKVGMLWACRTDPNGPGARRNGPWIRDDGTFDLTAKAVVSGAVMWPARFSIKEVDGKRVFSSNDLPNHPTGVFPVSPTDPAFRTDPNPNRIREQNVFLELPMTPALAPEPGCAPGAVGILLTGVSLFSGIDALGRDAVAHEVQDSCNGHPQVTGAYHYHNLTHCMDDKRLADGHSAQVGYALDGFGIFGPYGEKGRPLKNADLDVCHGHTHAIPWDGKIVEMYHYHGTWEFPYSIGCMRGRVSMAAVMSISGGPQEARLRGLPNLEVAAKRLGITFDRLREALGPPPPDLLKSAATLNISVEKLREALENAR